MSKIEVGAKLAAIVAAIIAVVVFVASVCEEREGRRTDRVNAWRKAAIQEVLQRDDNSALKISELLTQIKSLAWDDPDLNIAKNELTEEQIRVLLLEMISAGIIYQVKGDIYELRFNTKTTSAADTTMDNIIGRQQKFLDALVKIRENPGMYNLESFYNSVVRDIAVNRVDYDIGMDMLIRSGRIKLDKDGKMSLVRQQMVPSPSGSDKTESADDLDS